MFSSLKSLAERFLPKSAFARGVGTLVGGTASAQLIGIAAAPILTRLYGPEDFGLLAVYTSLLAMIGVAGSLRYELAIPIAKSDEEAANLTILCLALLAGTTGVTAVASMMFGGIISEKLGVRDVASYLWLLPLGVFAGGAYVIFNYYAIRTGRFATIAATKLKQALAMLVIQMMAYKLGSLALLLAQLVGRSAGTASLAGPFLKSGLTKKTGLLGLSTAASRYRRFPQHDLLGSFANMASWELPVTLIASLFSPVIAGYYALSNRILLVPKYFVSSAVGDVYFSFAPRALQDGTLRDLTLKVYRQILAVASLPLVVILVAGPELFSFVFGATWREAGTISQWFTVPLLVMFAAIPFTRLFAVLELQGRGLVFHLVLLLLRGGAVLAGLWWMTANQTLVLLAMVTLVCWLGFLVWLASILQIPLASFFMPLMREIALALGMCIPLIASLQFFNGSLALVIGLGLTAPLMAIRYSAALKSSA